MIGLLAALTRRALLRLGDLFPTACVLAAGVGIGMSAWAFRQYVAVEGLDRPGQFGESVGREAGRTDEAIRRDGGGQGSGDEAPER